MRKKIQVETSERRRFNPMGRVTDIFERKFDGFPAKLPPKSGRLQAEDGDIFGIDFEALLEELLEQEQGVDIPNIPPCPDTSEGYDCHGNPLVAIAVPDDNCWYGTNGSGNDFSPSRNVWRGTRNYQTGDPTFTSLGINSSPLGGWAWDTSLSPDGDSEGRNYITWTIPDGANRVRLRGKIIGNAFGAIQSDPNQLPCDFAWQLWDAEWDTSTGPTTWNPGHLVVEGEIIRDDAIGTSAGWEFPFDVTWEPSALGKAQFYLVNTSTHGRSRSSGLTFCSIRGTQGGTLDGPRSSVEISPTTQFEFSYCVDSNAGAIGSGGSGCTYNSDLIRVSDTQYDFPMQYDYIIEVFLDGASQIKGIDYNISADSMSIVFVNSVDIDSVVRSRFVAA